MGGYSSEYKISLTSGNVVFETLNTSKYNRFRFGVGAEFGKGRQVDYVLGEWTDEEEKIMPERLDKGISLIKSFATAGLANTMNTFNGK